MTTRLYQQDVNLREWDAQITSVHPAEAGDTAKAGRTFAVTLDQSAFFPEGGGQSCDLGAMGPYEVIDVQESGDGDVIHIVRIPEKDQEGLNADSKGTPKADSSAAASKRAEQTNPPAAAAQGKKKMNPSAASAKGNSQPDQSSTCGDAGEPCPGQSLHCSLDWKRRFDNMQRHCGEHILSGIFYARCGGVNRGFHMGDEYMTIDISLEDDPTDPDTPRPDSIDMQLALECERRANQVVWANEKVTVFRFEQREEAEKMPLRKALAFDEDISIVCIGSPENAADCVACCGTHPTTAGQVGLIKIYKVENYKNMFRVYFEAGERALADYDRKHDILTDLSNRFSSSIEDFPDKIRVQEERLADLKDQLYHAKKALIDGECAALDKALQETDSEETSPMILWPLDHLTMDDAFDMAKRYMKKTPKLILLYAKQNTSFILVSGGEPKCGALVREYASFYQGKGGGNDVSARAIFSSEENAMLFADLLSKHLR